MGDESPILTGEKAPIEAFPELPVLTDTDLQDGRSVQLSTYLTNFVKVLNDKQKRQLASDKSRYDALNWTLFLDGYVRAARDTGVTAAQYINANPIKVHGKKGVIQEIQVSAANFSRRLQIYLKVHGVDSIDHIKLDGPTPMILELADGRFVNPGAPFTINDGQTLLVLGTMTQNRKWKYKRIHNFLKRHVKNPGYAFRDYWDCPTLSQIRTFLEQVKDSAFIEYLLYGFSEMYERFGFARKVDWGDFNFWWAGDAFCMRDVWFYDPDRPEGNRLFQPWVSFIIECSSRICVSHIAHPEAPNTNHGLFLLRDGINPTSDEDFPRIARGKPVNIREDNQPPLGGELYKEGCRRLGISYRPIDPSFSSQNGLAERTVETFKGKIRVEIMERLAGRYRQTNKSNPIGISDWPIFVRMVKEAIYQVYQHTAHDGLDGETPYNACLRLMSKNPPKEVDPEEVILATSLQGNARMTKHGVCILGEHYLDKEKFDGLEGKAVAWVIDPLQREPKKAKIIYQGELVCEAPRNIPLGAPVLRGAFKRGARALPPALGRAKRTLDSMLLQSGLASPPRTKKGRPIPKTENGFKAPETLGPLPELFGGSKS